MIRRFFLFLSILLISISNLQGMDNLPDDIYFKTMEHGFSYEYLYALKDGKIWIKPNTKNTGVNGEWELFNKTGLPSKNDCPSFRKNDRIVQFSTEGTVITAVSNKGRFYIWQPTVKKDTAWIEETGSPFEDALYLPKNKAWSFSLGIMRAPWKRLTPMHENDIVSYWEDIDGNRTEFGFTATIYAVAPDGQKIRYTDTGLPTSWNKAFTSPDRGQFIVDNISSAASTVLVINSTGKMYTKMIDYELEGGCPALRYVYTRGKRTKGDEIAPLMTSIRTLPLPDWRWQEPVEEVIAARKSGKGKAAVTKKITILLTGKGNSARELRIQGRDSAGRYGYWKKMIFDKKWDFIATGEKFSGNEIISKYMEEAPAGRVLDRNYRGKLKKSGDPELSVELLNFYYYSTPSVLRVHVNEKEFDMKFHTVDLWSPTEQKKNFPELVGSPAGEPKLLQGTIEIPDSILNSSDPDIKGAVDKYFRNFNLVPLVFMVTADDKRVIIKSKIIQRNLEKNMSYEYRKRIKLDLSSGEDNAASHSMMFYTSLAELPELEIPDDWTSMTGKDTGKVKKLIELNNNALKEMRKLKFRLQIENLKSGLSSALGVSAYYLFNGVISIIGLPSWKNLTSDPGMSETFAELGGVSYTGGTSLSEYAVMNLKKAIDDPDDYDHAVKIFKKRIKLLRRLKDVIEDKPDRN